MKNLIDKLEFYFGKKAPQLPEEFKTLLVKIMPYAAILAILSVIPAIFTLVGLGTIFRGFYGYEYYRGMNLLIVSQIIVLVLYAIAIPDLFNKKAKGWNFMLYAVLVNIIGFLSTPDNIAGVVIGIIIGLYILFQIKPHYFGEVTKTSTEELKTSVETPAQQKNLPPENVVEKTNEETPEIEK